MKKVLVISYYWPPAGGPGVQRWLKFVKYLPSFGIEPVVYVPSNPHYPLQDQTLEEEVPEVRIIRKRILEPYGLANLVSGKNTRSISSGIIPEERDQGLLQKALLFIRGNLFIPDARKFWIRPSVRFLSDYLNIHGIDTIITTGPPHSMHLIGLGVKKRTGARWIADFRDPWTQIGYHDKLRLLPGSRRLHQALEKRVLQQADALITTSFSTAAEFRGKTSRPVHVITNGYDVERIGEVIQDPRFTLAHIGSLLSGRDPENLWRALGELVSEDAEFAKDLRLELTGSVGESVLGSIRAAGLAPYLCLREYVPHSEALKLQRAASLLLLIEIDREETRSIIPGKLFEYMVSNRPILAVGPEGADFKQILEQTNTGSFFGYGDRSEMKSFLREKYQEFQKGSLQSHPVDLQKYSRRNLTGQLSKIIKSD